MRLVGDSYSWQQNPRGRARKAPKTDPWDRPPSTFLNRRPDLEKALVFHTGDSPHMFAVDRTRPEATHPEPEKRRKSGRWPVVRIGEREEILWPVRRAVARRDNFTCQICHHSDALEYEIDHIVPWSAGGSDQSTNLRLLCKPCNQQRGNSHDLTERHVMPVTWWCVECWTEDHFFWRSEWIHENTITEWLNIDHRVNPDGQLVAAFCANCRITSQTDVTL